MLNKYLFIRSVIVCMLVIPFGLTAQASDKNTKALRYEIAKLSDMVETLKAEQARSYQIEAQMNKPAADFGPRDSLRLLTLKRKQADSRARIDQLTLDILKLSRALENPNRRFALARKLKEPQQAPLTQPVETPRDSSNIIARVNVRSIDLAAVKLVRMGKSLDQARLMTIEALEPAQVLAFYRDLERNDRYELYDIADEIVANEGVELAEARRSAIYFYLYTR